MNKKKALFLYEGKRVRWFALAGLAASLFYLYVLGEFLSSNLNSTGSSETIASTICHLLMVASPILMASIALMTIFQFGDWHRKKEQEFLLSLPFTRRERFLAKLLCGYATLTVTMLVTGIGTLIIRNEYAGQMMKSAAISRYYEAYMGNDTLWHTIQLCLQLWFVALAVYSVLVFVHMIVSRGIPAALIGLGICAAPYYLWYVSYGLIIGWIQGGIHQKMMTVPSFRDAFRDVGSYMGLVTGSGFERIDTVYGWDSGDLHSIVNYPNFLLVAVILLGIAVVTAGLAYWIAGREDMARGGMVVQKKSARIFLSTGIAVCFGTAVGLLGSSVYAEVRYEGYSLALFIVISVIAAAAVYALCRKLLSLTLK